MAGSIIDVIKPYKRCLIICLTEFVIAGIFFQFYKDEVITVIQRIFLVFMIIYLLFGIYLLIYIKIKYPESYHGWTGFHFEDTIYDKKLKTPDIIIRRKIFNNIICCMGFNFFNLIAILILLDMMPVLFH